MSIGSSCCSGPATRTARAPDSNPFATRYVRPGALPYLFPAGTDRRSLVAGGCARHGGGPDHGPTAAQVHAAADAAAAARRRRTAHRAL